MRQRSTQQFGDIATIYDDGATDIENYQPYGRCIMPRTEHDRRNGNGCQDTLQRLSAGKFHNVTMLLRLLE